jgi:hypothetical protein
MKKGKSRTRKARHDVMRYNQKLAAKKPKAKSYDRASYDGSISEAA